MGPPVNFFPPHATPSGSAATPSGYGGPTAGSGQRNTPRNYPPSTPQQHQGANWNGPSGAMPPPPPPARAAPVAAGRPGSRGAGAAWSNIAETWNERPDKRRSGRTPQPKTPLYATPGASSQMSISPTSSPNYNSRIGGDQTPLVDESVDEWN